MDEKGTVLDVFFKLHIPENFSSKLRTFYGSKFETPALASVVKNKRILTNWKLHFDSGS
jgi:hypothetical protein